MGAIIGLFIHFIVDVKEYGIDWDDHDAKIKAYAAKHNVKIHGLNLPSYEKSSGETAQPGPQLMPMISGAGQGY